MRHASELGLHRLLLAILVTLLAVFVAFLLYLYPALASDQLEEIASLLIVIVVAVAFVMMGMAEGAVALHFGMRHKRELLSYLVLGLLSIASGLYLAIAKAASLQTITVVVATHALLFGIGEMRLSQHMQRHPRERKLLFLFGLCELALAIALISGWRMSSERAAMLLGYAAILSMLQLLPFLLHKPRSASAQAKTS